MSNGGQARRWVKRNGRAATLVQWTGAGTFTPDGEDLNDANTATQAVVVLRGAGSVIRANPEGEDEVLDADVFIPDDIVVTVKGAPRRPEIAVGPERYVVGEVDPVARKGLTRLLCSSMRVA